MSELGQHDLRNSAHRLPAVRGRSRLGEQLSSGLRERPRSDLSDRLSVYLVTDERPDINSLLAVVRQALIGGTTVVQLRRKHDDGRMLVDVGRELRRLTREFGALYIVNDRVDVAMLTDADGVHVGQSDIACADVRRLVGPDKIIGVSATTVAEAEGALADGADYIGAGSVYPTASKDDADISGLDGLRDIVETAAAARAAAAARGVPVAETAAAARGVPVVAIGGINQHNAAEVLATGADGLAVVSAIMQAADPAAASRALCELAARARR